MNKINITVLNNSRYDWHEKKSSDPSCGSKETLWGKTLQVFCWYQAERWR